MNTKSQTTISSNCCGASLLDESFGTVCSECKEHCGVAFAYDGAGYATTFTDGTPVEVDADGIIKFEYLETDRRRQSRRAADTRQSLAVWNLVFAVLIFALGAATGYYLGALEAVEIWRANQ